MPPTPSDMRGAVDDLHRYLADDIAPMMAADAMQVLVRADVHETVRGVLAWIDTQYRGVGQRASFADYAFHAVKKIHALGELELLPADQLMRHVVGVAQGLLQQCPREQQPSLRAYFELLGESEGRLARPVEILHRPAGTEAPVAGAASPPPPAATPVASPPASAPELSSAGVSAASAERLERLETLVGRLESRLAATREDAQNDEAPPELVAGIVSAAARDAENQEELRTRIRRLEELGVDTSSEALIRQLVSQMPAWILQAGETVDTSAVRSTRSAQAIERLVGLAEDADEALGRFSDILRAAVERINQGDLARAVALFDLAESAVLEQSLDASAVDDLCARASEQIDLVPLAEAAGEPERHAVVKRILDFFPRFGVQGLLSWLYAEEVRETRFRILTVLRAHGEDARSACLAQLDGCLDRSIPDPEGYFRRNLVFVLRRMPRGEAGPTPDEIRALGRTLVSTAPLIVLKESIGALGAMRAPGAERALVGFLRTLESTLLEMREGPHPRGALRDLLDRTIDALARQGTVSSARHVANHALREEDVLGASDARLDVLAQRDLSGDADLARALVAHLRASMPRKVLGMRVARENERAMHLVRALSGSASMPDVREALEEAADAQPGSALAREARGALDAPPRGSRSGAWNAVGGQAPLASLSGDLEAFGLPTLLQTFSLSATSGSLILESSEGTPLGRIELDAGRMVRCAAGELVGESALYQLLEEPSAGRFQLALSSFELDPESTALPEAGDPMSLVLEGLRRHDELGEARAIVGEATRLEATGRPAPDAEDEVGVRLLELIREGRDADACVRALRIDTYGVYRRIADWLSGGVLRAAGGGSENA